MDFFAYSCSKLGTTYNTFGILHDIVVAGIRSISYHSFSLTRSIILALVFQVLQAYAISGGVWQLALLVGVSTVYPLLFVIVRHHSGTSVSFTFTIYI